MRALVSALLAAGALSVQAALPVARLDSIFPLGGRQGTSVDLRIEGADLDDAARLHFSAPGITAERQAPGRFAVTIASNVPPGLYEARAAGRFGISNPRFFTVSDRAELAVSEPRHTPETALAAPIESVINAFATAAAADFYRFETAAGQPVTIACQGEPFDSRMKPSLILHDPAGREVQRDRRDGRLHFTPSETGPWLLKVHDLQFRGGKQFPYRLTLTQRADVSVPERLPRLPVPAAPAETVHEEEPNDNRPQQVTAPCEIAGRFFPANDLDRFAFEAKKGEVFWVDVVSERLGLPTDPFVVIQREAGDGTVQDLQELADLDTNLGGPLFNTSTRDPRGRVEIKEDGIFRVQVRDLFNARPDPARPYRLSIRRETPDFDLIALVVPPPVFDREKREAKVWSWLLRRNESLQVKVLALRRDGFTGEISLRIGGLPAHARASETVIPEGQNAAWLSITADDQASDWFGPIQIIGAGKRGGTEIERAARGASVLWDVPDYNNEAVRSRLTQELMLATAAETVPFALDPKQTAWQVPPAEKLAIPLRLARSAEFKQPVKLRAYLNTQNDPLKEWDVDGAAGETVFELDVKQAKLGPGAHQLIFLAQTSGKIRRIRPEEIAALEAAAKENESARKELEERQKWRDVTGIFCSPVVKVFVNPAATALK